MEAEILEVRIGPVAPFGPKDEPSAYRKTPVNGSVAVTETGIAGDEQADLKNHGGQDKAILHYDVDHYHQWRLEQPHLAERLASPGAFGENISSRGINETDVCLGDRLRLGSALVEVSQGRQPCWKLGHQFGDPDMVSEVLRRARGGWYYRVIEPGTVEAGAKVALHERPYPDWPVARLIATLFGERLEPGGKAGEKARQELRLLAANPKLAESWSARARRLAER